LAIPVVVVDVAVKGLFGDVIVAETVVLGLLGDAVVGVPAYLCGDICLVAPAGVVFPICSHPSSVLVAMNSLLAEAIDARVSSLGVSVIAAVVV
jgi:hypothetical protein